jgi:TolA-binding protein
MRAALVAVVLASLADAPLQCSRTPDPSLRREDSAGDALWDLAQEFKAKGNATAARETLQKLVDKYPSNRHAPAAREQLAADGGSGDP